MWIGFSLRIHVKISHVTTNRDDAMIERCCPSITNNWITRRPAGHIGTTRKDNERWERKIQCSNTLSSPILLFFFYFSWENVTFLVFPLYCAHSLVEFAQTSVTNLYRNFHPWSPRVASSKTRILENHKRYVKEMPRKNWYSTESPDKWKSTQALLSSAHRSMLISNITCHTIINLFLEMFCFKTNFTMSAHIKQLFMNCVKRRSAETCDDTGDTMKMSTE